jgi:hypothetical protein
LNGGTWAPPANPPSGSSGGAFGIWGANATDIFVVGAGVWYYNGTAWAGVFAEDNSYLINAIWGSDAQHIWGVDNNGNVLQCTGCTTGGSTWSKTVTGVGNSLNGIWGTSPTDIWAVGGTTGLPTDPGEVQHYDGTSWTPSTIHVSSALNAVWGSSTSSVWAVAANGEIWSYNGTSWASITAGTGKALNGIWGWNLNDIWAVGANGTVMHYTGG